MASYTQLEPSSFSSLGVAPPTFDGVGSFFSTSLFVYTLLFTAIIGAAFYEYVLVGIYRMQASEAGIRKSNETFKRTTLGLLGVFSLFLIIAALNRGMLTGNVDLSALKVRGGVGGGATTPGSGIAIIPSNTQTQPIGSKTYEERKASHSANVAELSSAGISTNKSGQLCSEEALKTGEGCTSLAYLLPQTITMLKNLKGSCPSCEIIVTGGTENGHKSHCEGGGNVDLRLLNSRNDPNNPDPLYVFLKKNATQTDVNSNCFIRYYYSGYKFCDEKPKAAQHFHVDSPVQCKNGSPI